MFRALAAASAAATGLAASFKSAAVTQLEGAPSLDKKKWTECEVLKTVPMTTGGGETGATQRVTLGCKCELTPVSMVFVRTKVGEKNVVKYYNPVEIFEDSFSIEVKAYPEGRVSGAIHAAKVGDTLQAKGPSFQYSIKPNEFKEVAVVVGGTGITPGMQLVNSILAAEGDTTKVTLIVANKNKDAIALDDVIARAAGGNYYVEDADGGYEIGYLDKAGQQVVEVVAADGTVSSSTTAAHGRVTVHHLISAEGNRITADSLKALLPAAGEGVNVVVCGPGSMMAAVCGPKAKDFTQGELTGYLKELGFESSMVRKF